MGHGLRPLEVYESGVSLDPGRFGWFVGPAELNVTMEGLHYSIFLNRSNTFYEQYIIDEDELNLLTRGNEHEYFVSPMCKHFRCATLLAEYKMETSFVQQQIKEIKGYLNILWLGSRFRSEIDRLYLKYTDYNASGKNKRFLVLHWNPSDVIDGKNTFQHIELPLCEESLSLWKSYCKYELTPIFKYHSKHLLADERLMHSLRLFWINNDELTHLFMDLDQKRSQKGYVTDGIYNELACDWLRYHIETYNLWISKEPMTLSIGAIFPIKKNTRGHQNLVYAVQSAVRAVNKNSTILRNYNLNVIENDGECKADVVMKSFIHLFNVPKLLGVVGPACSETVEPIAGISRHTNMAVISYSAEGASFLDRQAYPFFFRTIGSNRQYEDVYTSLMKDFGWNRVAALTEDGQKYTEYISHMEATLKNNNMELIINKKFLNDITHAEMNKYLVDLKNRHAKIIIADIHNKYAQMALCEAFKLEMTGYQGYVWFLPSWLSKDWKFISAEGNQSCSSHELERAFEGHFSIMHSPFGSNKTIMQEHINIEKWLESYSASVSSVSKYTAFAYDAVWAYALAADKLLHENRDTVENLRSKNVVNRFVDLIWETDFVGLSGRVRFGQGGSRITELIIRQWRNHQSVEVGKYIPQLVGKGRNLRTNGGNLVLNKSAIVWLFEGKPPSDGTFDCSFSALAEFLNTECQNATVAFTALICMIVVVFISLISFYFWKRRYDKKLKRSAKIMKNFGIDLLSPSRSNVNTLDKWEIPKENVVVNRRLGEGAFGTVYGGEAKIGDEGWTAVAVKTLKSGASTEDRLDFLSEAEAMKRFDHKNIVSLLGVCLQSEPIYTIMEFMLYGDLKTYLLARRHMVNEKVTDDSDISSKRLTMYAMDVSRGLAYLAQQKYVHRDIACRNCLVNAQRVVKLGDFGMSRPTYESDYYRFNRKGMLPVRWMAPESLALGMFTPSSDVWAFGVVLFEIITFGSYPYQGLTNNQVLEYVKSGNTLSIPIGLKPYLEGLIKACWNQDPKKRPSASEIVEYISKYPTLLSASLDFPSASVEMAETESDELELLPKSRKCSPLKNESVLDVVAQASIADNLERFNNFSNERETTVETNIEMPTHTANSGVEPLDSSPITPDGYSIMSPLLMNHAESPPSSHQQTPF
ncbi:receptor-type guanylate cyclase gcy-17-like isoform X2 [Calliphora vicina]